MSVPFPTQGDWYVLHTRSRQERKVSDELLARGVGCFLPLVHQIRQYGHRKVASSKPMFPGYLFLRGERDDAFAADRTTRVAGIIEVTDQQHLNWELTNLYRAIAAEAPLDPYPYLQPGKRVAVRSGPLKGLEGWIDERPDLNRLILKIDMLGRAMSMEIDAAVLDVVG